MDQTPFHDDELAAQARAGTLAPGAGIRPFMPEQHRTFFATLPYVVLGTQDEDGWPIATLLSGPPGFVASPDPTTLRIAISPDRTDPVRLAAGREAGLLGLDLANRRRNRANGIITEADDAGFAIAVRQSFGNCPQYIQRRIVGEVAREPGPVERLWGLDAEARALIAQSDTLFVATRARPEAGSRGGADISHRGGRPGFVRIAGDTLEIPDFRGNRYFNTLGNLIGEPRAALLFLDFETGDLLQVQGFAEIDWAGGREVAGAERSWRMRVVRGWRRRGAVGLRWTFVDQAPTTLRTGLWSAAA